jgi:hypothetical protein
VNYRYYNYFTEIEEYFVKLRGKHLLVSPLDWSLIESWKQTEIPLHVVLRGIDRAFEKHRARGTAQRVNSIFYCQPSVMECFEEYQAARIGEEQHPVQAERDDAEKVAQALESLQEQTDLISQKFSDRESVARVQRIMSQLIEEIRTAKQAPMADIENTLQVCDSILLEAARHRLDKATLEALQKEAKKDLKIYKRKVTPEMYARIEQNFVHRKIRQEYNLPEFTLFYLG